MKVQDKMPSEVALVHVSLFRRQSPPRQEQPNVRGRSAEDFLFAWVLSTSAQVFWVKQFISRKAIASVAV